MTKFTESYNLQVLTGSTGTVYTCQIDGGELDDVNKFRLTLRGLATLSETDALLTFTFTYGAALQAVITFGTTSPPNPNAAFVCQALLSSLGGPSVQALHAEGMIAVPPADWVGTPAGYGAGTEDSASDQNLTVSIMLSGGTGSSVGVEYDTNNVGDGEFAATPTLGGSAETGEYVLVCTAESPDSGTFSVTTPSGDPLSDLTVGSVYSSLHINGTLQDGATDFQIGDTIIVAVATTSDVVPQYASLEKLSYIEPPDIPESDIPNTQIVTLYKINRLPHSLFKDVRFYAELTHNLSFMGIGTATFTRASTSTATWRDGAAHAVAVNEPRFEYSGDTAIGLRITTATETLTFPTANGLNGSGTMFWKEDGVVKRTPTDTNPFNSSGTWIGSTNVNISHILQFDASRTLTATEINVVVAILNS